MCIRDSPSTEPRRMSGMPTAMPSVSGSPRMMTPRRTATSGLTYVITVEREGPTSRISAKNKRKASAVQTSASAATAPTVCAETDAGMESRHAGEADEQACQAARVEVLARAHGAVQHGREERHRAHEEPRQGAREAQLGVRQQQPGDG